MDDPFGASAYVLLFVYCTYNVDILYIAITYSCTPV